MRLIYSGKTKDVYELENPAHLRFVFSDRVTQNDQGEIDPGGNVKTNIEISGQAKACLAMSSFIFAELHKYNIATHMLAYDLDALSMDAHRVELFQPGLEWICRWVATGSFLRRYQSSIPYLYDGFRLLEPVYEITLKNDQAGDPPVNASALLAMGLIPYNVSYIFELNKTVFRHIHQMFAVRGLDLWDIKIEYGLLDGKPVIIDEVGPGSCRAFKAGTQQRINGLELAQYFL